LVFE